MTSLIEGAKLFIVWPPTPHNIKLMQPVHRLEMTMANALQLMYSLQKPRFNYLHKGDCIHLPPGSIHMVLSPKSGALYGLSFVNPSIRETELAKTVFDSFVTSVLQKVSNYSCYDHRPTWSGSRPRSLLGQD